jgi:hypothetical protein
VLVASLRHRELAPGAGGIGRRTAACAATCQAQQVRPAATDPALSGAAPDAIANALLRLACHTVRPAQKDEIAMFSWKKFTAGLAERRTGWRTTVRIPATVRTAAGRQSPIGIEDLTLSGFRAVIPVDVAAGERLLVSLPVARALHATVVWRDGDRVGCRFATPLGESSFAALVRACV